jgi:hypothetical protein
MRKVKLANSPVASEEKYCGCKALMVHRPEAKTPDKLICSRAGITCWSFKGQKPPASWLAEHEFQDPSAYQAKPISAPANAHA